MLNFLLAGMGSAYGAFIPAYLTTQGWTMTHIGIVLTVNTAVGMVSQVPAGLIIDAASGHRRRILVFGILATGAVPLIFVVLPANLPVLLAVAIQAAAGSFFGPIIATISLGLAGTAGLGERIGRNARFGSIGGALGAAMMGGCGYLGSQRLGFMAAALLTVPALMAVRAIGIEKAQIVPDPAAEARPGFFAPFRLLLDRRLLIYATCVALYQVASVAVLQLAAIDVTARLGSRGALVIAAILIVPQVVVALVSPWIGRAAARFGHRLVLLASFVAVPVRGVLFASVRNPYALVPVQALEGAGGAAFGIMMPLIAANLTGGRHYTLCLSLLGLAGGAGSAISTALAGWSADNFGRPLTYWVLAGAGIVAVALVALAMPETGAARPTGVPAPSRA